MSNNEGRSTPSDETGQLSWELFDNLYWLAMGLEEICAQSHLFGSSTQQVIDLCCERWVPEKFVPADIDNALDVFRRLLQVLEDDLDGNFPTDYGEYYNSGLDAIKHVYLCGFTHEIGIAEGLISQLESPGHAQ